MKGMCILLLSLFLLSGCVVQSVNTFYVEDAVVEKPEFNGQWKVVDKPWDSQAAQEMIIRDGVVYISDDLGMVVVLDARFFSVDGMLFLDTVIEAGGNDNMWARAHTFPVHCVSKVIMEGSRIAIIPMNYDWLFKQIEAGNVAMAYTLSQSDDTNNLFIQNSESWMNILSKYKNSGEVFPEKNRIVIEKIEGPEEPAGETE